MAAYRCGLLGYCSCRWFDRENSDLVGEPVVDDEATDSRPRDSFSISAPN